MLGGEWFAGPLQGDQVLRSVEIRQRQVGRESLLGDNETKFGFWFHPGALEQQRDCDAFECVIEPAPGRDAMDVAEHGLARQGEQLLIRERERPLDEPRNLERPFRGIDHRYVRSEEHTSELQSLTNLVCRLL